MNLPRRMSRQIDEPAIVVEECESDVIASCSAGIFKSANASAKPSNNDEDDMEDEGSTLLF